MAAVKTFRDNGVMWEMWNEPDEGGGNNGLGPVHPSVYAKLAVEVGKAIHSTDPHVLYVGPALLGWKRAWRGSTWAKWIFHDGVLAEFAAVTWHPYRKTYPETVCPDYAKFRKLIGHYSPPGKVIPLFSGEWGYSTTWLKRDASRQGKYLAREFLTNLMCRIPLSIWYDWHNDGPPGPTRPPGGSVEISHIAISTNSKSMENLKLFAKGSQWTFNNGAEFPGAKGSFELSKDGPSPVGIIKYNFDGGGNYVAAGVNVAIKKVGMLTFKVKSAHQQQILIRIVDSTSQTDQWTLPYSKANHWQTLHVNLADGSPTHYGGNNNGIINFPIVTIDFGVNSIPVLNKEFHFGLVRFNYHPHRHWVYTPKPAFFVCRTLTHTLRGFHFEKRVKESNPNNFVLVFACGKLRRWVAWTVVKPKPGHGVVLLPVPAGTYRVINYLDSEHIKAKAGAAGLNLQLSTGPQYVVPAHQLR